MNRIGCVFFAGLFGLLLLGADNAPPALHFPMHGYSIAPLEASPASGRGKLLQMFLPETNGFAPNINILTQDSPGTIDDYIALSKQEMTQNGWNVIKANKLDDKTAVIEFAGKANDLTLHWYSKASLKGDEVILITATATEDQWTTVSTQLQACVDSFQRDADK